MWYGTFIVQRCRAISSASWYVLGCPYTWPVISLVKAYSAQVIPNRGAWLELNPFRRYHVRQDWPRTRKLPITALLRACQREEISSVRGWLPSAGNHRKMKPQAWRTGVTVFWKFKRLRGRTWRWKAQSLLAPRATTAAMIWPASAAINTIRNYLCTRITG